MKFDVTKLHDFLNVKFYRASDSERGGWNGYGQGRLGVNFIIKCDSDKFDSRGMGQLTYHNELSKAGGLNLCIVRNFVMERSEKEPSRLTFKGASDTIGSNRLKNMYTMKMDSIEDAKRLMDIVHLLKTAAKHATEEGNRILLPDPRSVEATAARTLIGADKQEVRRQIIVAKLVQLAIDENGDLPLVSHKQAAGAQIVSDGIDSGVENSNRADGEDDTDDISVTPREDNDRDESTEDEFEPLTPDSVPYQASQQWESAFFVYND